MSDYLSDRDKWDVLVKVTNARYDITKHMLRSDIDKQDAIIWADLQLTEKDITIAELKETVAGMDKVVEAARKVNNEIYAANKESCPICLTAGAGMDKKRAEEGTYRGAPITSGPGGVGEGGGAAEGKLCGAREELDSYNNRMQPYYASIRELEIENKRLWEAVEYVGNRLNWIESDNGYEMKRPGGGGRSGIMLISETLTPWAYINKVMGLRRRAEGGK